MNYFKDKRQKLGLTQSDIAKKSGLSIRTIQRVEKSEIAPKGYTLKMLANVFDMETTSITEKFLIKEDIESPDKVSIRIINISALGFFIIPFGNIIIPLILWMRKRKSPIIDKIGRKIINFQIIWTILMSIALCISAFIITPVPLILYVLFLAIAINLFVVFRTAYFIHKEQFNFLNIPVKLL